jgi:hypothetical protein
MIILGRRLVFVVVAFSLLGLTAAAQVKDKSSFFPLSQVQPGMKGTAYTIYSGDQIEKVDLVVLGILHNALGPKQDVILVQLLGEEAGHSGVVAGMSGSPVYFEGKLAGALSLKLGIFTKEAIGGVTPIENMMDVERSSAPPASIASSTAETRNLAYADVRVPIPANLTGRMGAGANGFLIPIETPLIATGLYPETIAQFAPQLSTWGMTVSPGGSAAPSAEDAKIKPGDMVGIDLIRGDLSISPGCTVTLVEDDRVLACGHPLFGLGAVAIPLSRAHVVTTLASSMASTKIISNGGTIGTLTQDRQTAVMGKLGADPPMIPIEVKLNTPAAEKNFHFEVFQNPRLTPLLVALATFNGIVSTPAYAEGSTLQLEGNIRIQGHSAVKLDDLFAPTDAPVPTGVFVALSVQSAFSRIFSNPYELPQVERIQLRVTTLPERRWAMIDNVWLEKAEVRPGESLSIKVLLQPYRGAPFIQEIPITIPLQASRGTLQLLVSDAEALNRNLQSLSSSSQARLPGLEELIKLVNRERQNDRLYATLLQPSPTLLVEDKEMPNAPMSEINVLDARHSPGGARLLYQSSIGEWSVEMHQVIAGERTLMITVK